MVGGVTGTAAETSIPPDTEGSGAVKALFFDEG